MKAPKNYSNFVMKKNRSESEKKTFRLSLISQIPSETRISLDLIEKYCVYAIEMGSEFFLPFITLESYLNFAELRYLQNNIKQAYEFWLECRNLFFHLFMNGNECLVASNSPYELIEKFYCILKRMARFLFCLDNKTINDNLIVLDSFLVLETQLFISRNQAMPEDLDLNEEIFQLDQHINSFASPNAKKETLSNTKIRKLKKRLMKYNRERRQSNEFSSFSDSSNRTDTLGFGGMFPNTGGTGVHGFELKDVSEVIWSLLYGIKLNQQKKVMRELSNEDLITKNRSLLNQIVKISQLARATNENLRMFLSEYNQKTKKTLYQSQQLLEQESNPLFSYESLRSIHPKMGKILFVVIFDDLIIGYIPKLGKKIISCFGGRRFPRSTGFQSFSGLQSFSTENTLKTPKTPKTPSENFSPNELSSNSEKRNSKNHFSLISSTLLEDFLLFDDDDDDFLYSPRFSTPTNHSFNIKITQQLKVSSHLSQSQIAFLSGLIFGEKEPENQEFFYESNFSGFIHTFLGISEIMNQLALHKEPEDFYPNFLICSKWLQIIPWENIYNAPLVRVFSFWNHLILNLKKSIEKMNYQKFFAIQQESITKQNVPFPRYFIFKSSKKSKEIVADERKQIESSVSEFLFQTNHTKQPNIEGKNQQKEGIYSFEQFPKSKYITNLDSSDFISNNSSLSDSISKNLKSLEFPVIVIPFSEILSLSKVLFSLVNSDYQFQLMILSQYHLPLTIKLITKNYEHILKKSFTSNQNKNLDFIDFFMNSIILLRKKLKFPLLFFSW
eukprot:Anaeramoba_ignava/a480497_42.p1 GENE.a480497_42~~a480497_42.p1  ORF type:complete len:801 (+),score=265.40 a480497_42:52-2403(+)